MARQGRKGRKGSEPEGPSLFDAPLREREEGKSPGAGSLPLFPELEEPPAASDLQREESAPDEPLEEGLEPENEAVEGDPDLSFAPSAPVVARLLAGIADLLIHGGVLVLLLWGVHTFGIPLDTSLIAPLGVFFLSFSFLYTVVPLAFWGQTPGMAGLGLMSCTPEGQHLTFFETARRWAALVITVALLGLPTLLAVGGRRSLADLASGARTVQLAETVDAFDEEYAERE